MSSNPNNNNFDIRVLGAGLAGCEAALWLAEQGLQVALYEQKPVKFSPAHKNAGFAELICSNSLKADRLDSASGLLKAEMKLLGSHLLPIAEKPAWQQAAHWQWTAMNFRALSPRPYRPSQISPCSARK